MNVSATTTEEGVREQPIPSRKKMFDRATRLIWASFPFKDFPDSMRGNREIAGTIMRHLPAGSSILDFGAGTCIRSAFMSLCGYRVSAYDDLSDFWYLQDGNKDRIFEFAREMGIALQQAEAGRNCPYEGGQFDLVMMIDILEHFHDSPFTAVAQALKWTKPHGLVLIVVPNAANLRKRTSLLLGNTNYPPFKDFFWYPPPWRGHVREYVLNDLKLLNKFMGLELVELRGIHVWVDVRLKSAFSKYLYLGITSLLSGAGLRDSLLLLARKPRDWNQRDVEKQRPDFSKPL